MSKEQKAIELPPLEPVRCYYSKSERGFFASHIHKGKIPSDAVEVAEAEWRGLLDAQSAGHEIVPGEGGRPVARLLVKSSSHHRSDLMAERDAVMARTQDLVERHRDEIDIGLGTTLTAAQYAELLLHRKALRQLPEHPDYLNDAAVAGLSLPTLPGFLR